MPCRGYDDNEIAAMNAEESRKLAQEVNKVTNMLCRVLGALKNHNQGAYQLATTQPIREWYEAHQVKDKERIRREALSKLTKEEKEALGL